MPIVSGCYIKIFGTIYQWDERKKNERYYQEKWCSEKGGTAEVKLEDDTRVDCIANIAEFDYAIEFDWAKKYAESIGQSLHYGIQTGHRAGIVLILQSPDEYKYVLRVGSIIEHYHLPITLWFIADYEDTY